MTRALLLLLTLTGCRACPGSPPPAVTWIFVPAPGSNATDAERLIALPTELAVQRAPGVRGVQSLSVPGQVTVRVELDTADLGQLAASLHDLTLPPEVETPRITAPAHLGAELVIVNDRLAAAELRALVDELASAWQRLPGVADVSVCGGATREVHVRVEPRRVGAMGVSFDDVVAALRSDHAEPPGVLVPVTVKLRAREMSELVVSVNATGEAVRLGDVATIEVAAAPDPCPCSPGAVCARLRRAAGSAPAINAARELVQRIAPPGTRLLEAPATLAAVLTGSDRDALRTAAESVASGVAEQAAANSAVVLGDDTEPELEVTRDPRCAISAAALANAVRAARVGVVIGETERGDIVRAFLGDARDASTLARLPVPLGDGTRMPLGACAHLVATASPRALLRFNLQPAVVVSVSVSDAGRSAEVRAAAAAHAELPEGVALRWVDGRDLLLQRRPDPPGMWP